MKLISDDSIGTSIDRIIEIETVTNCNLLQVTVVSREDWFGFFVVVRRSWIIQFVRVDA